MVSKSTKLSMKLKTRFVESDLGLYLTCPSRTEPEPAPSFRPNRLSQKSWNLSEPKPRRPLRTRPDTGSDQRYSTEQVRVWIPERKDPDPETVQTET